MADDKTPSEHRPGSGRSGVGDSASSSTASATGPVVGMANRTTQAGSDIATRFISSLGLVMESTVHAVGNVGVTAVTEASRVLTTTARGVRDTIGSVVTGESPNYAERIQQENQYREKL